MAAREFGDTYSNFCQRLTAPSNGFAISKVAEVRIADTLEQARGALFVDIESLPDTLLVYLLPRRFCESDRFGWMATRITAGEALGYGQIAAITDWLHERIRDLPGTSDVPISAIDVNRRQVCVYRDLSHLGIALCRGLSIPARLVVGYLHALAPMDMHAWFEAYVDDRWYAFDATQAVARGGYMAIGYGRDAADIAIFNPFGSPTKNVAAVINPA